MKNDWHVPCLRGVVGTWVYYPALMSAKQIAANVMASKDIRESKALDDYLQRNLKPRVNKIVKYLQTRDTRFFNSIIIGVFDALPNWIELELASIAAEYKIKNVENAQASLGIMVFKGNEKMFAIDGQHRIDAIQKTYQKTAAKIEEDQYAVIFVAHLDTEEGKVRTRRLFSDINKNAVSVSEGDKVIIDEDELPAITTRRLYAGYPPFKKGKEIAVSEKKEQIEQDGIERFTSLLALHTICKVLKKLYTKPKGTLDCDPENVDAFKSIVVSFLDYIIKSESSLNSYFKKKRTTLKAERKNNRNVFFRPVGLELLARIYVHFLKHQRISLLTKGLSMIAFKCPGGVFDGIIWNNGKIDATGKVKTAAVNLCLYLLDQLSPAEELKLRNVLRDIKKEPEFALPAKLNLR